MRGRRLSHSEAAGMMAIGGAPILGSREDPKWLVAGAGISSRRMPLVGCCSGRQQIDAFWNSRKQDAA
jgi:hypothetical protein